MALKAAIQPNRLDGFPYINHAYALDLLDPALVRISERWTDREALAKHVASDHIAKWRACWDEVGITDRSLRQYEAVPESF